MLDDEDFASLYEDVKGNLEFIRQDRHSYTEILAASQIVLAIGFTTPGTEALLIGKRVIYYSELYCGGQQFCHIPDLIARDADELEDLFRKALTDCQEYCRNISSCISLLDPFRDGMAKRRIMDCLQLSD